MDAAQRPHLHALVGYWSDVFGLCSEPRVMPLEDAVDFARIKGFVIFVDPADERELAAHERLERMLSAKRNRKWL